jgi:uncharacterized protein (DUF4415 family)
MATATVELGPVPALWTRQHLLGLEDLTAEEITLILDKAEIFKQAMAEGQRKIPLLVNKTCVNLFFEKATLRTPRQPVAVTVHVDPDVLAWFQAQGREYEQRVNAALRIYAEAHES